jgi:hypothetical protein
LIESYRSGSKQREKDDKLLRELIDQARIAGWRVEHLRALFLRCIIEKLDGHFQQTLQTVQEVHLLATSYNDKLFILRSAFAIPDTYYYFGNATERWRNALK